VKLRVKQDVAFYNYARSATQLPKKEMLPVAQATLKFKHCIFDIPMFQLRLTVWTEQWISFCAIPCDTLSKTKTKLPI
jgi:hypothetical protein